MKPIRQAACTTLAGVALLLARAGVAPRLAGQELQETTQPPAPVVRVPPRLAQPRVPQPRVLSPAQTTAPGATRTGSANPRATGSSTGNTPATQTTPRAVQPTSSATAAPRTAVKAATPTVAGTATTSTTTTERKPPALSTTGVNRSVVVLDPAHGGADSGGRIGDTTLEKNVTLALAFRLRSLLVARGFTVVLTRDSDVPAPPGSTSTSNAGTTAAALSLDDRAGIANHARASACLLLHATGRGTGVHLYRSDLEAAPNEAALLPWLTAQAAWVPASEGLEQGITAALGRSHIALVSSTASVRPVDSLTCPALVLELAPETDVPASVNDAGYQERVAAAIAGALVVWQNTVQTPARIPFVAPPRAVHHTAPAASAEGTQP